MYDVSIIIPAYNIAPYMESCLQSLIDQTLQNREIIIVDDGSKDNTLELARQYAQKYPYISVLTQANKGASAARNTGLRAATGKYVIFVDGDDYIDLDALQYLYDLAERDNLDIVRGKYYILYEQTGEIRDSNKNSTIPSEGKIISANQWLQEAIFAGSAYEVSPCLPLTRRDFMMKNDLFFIEGICHEDHEYTIRTMLVKDARVMQTNRLFYYYRVRPGSRVRTPDPEMYLKAFDGVRRMDEMIRRRETDMDAATRDAAYTGIAKAFGHTLTTYGLSHCNPEHNKKPIDKIRFSWRIKRIVLTHGPATKRFSAMLFLFAPWLLRAAYRLKMRIKK